MLLILWGIFLLGNILSLSDRVHTLIHGKMVQCPRTRASAIFIVRSSGKRGEVDKYESCTWTWKWASVIFLPHWDEINKIVQVSVQSKTSRSEIHKILKQLILISGLTWFFHQPKPLTKHNFKFYPLWAADKICHEVMSSDNPIVGHPNFKAQVTG